VFLFCVERSKITAEHIGRLRTNDVLPKRLAKLVALDSLAINSRRAGVVIASSGVRPWPIASRTMVACQAVTTAAVSIRLGEVRSQGFHHASLGVIPQREAVWLLWAPKMRPFA